MLHIIITNFYRTIIDCDFKKWQHKNFGLNNQVPKELVGNRVQLYLIDKELFEDKSKFLSVKNKIAGSIEDLSRDKLPVVLVFEAEFFDSFNPGWKFFIEEFPLELYEGEPYFHRVEPTDFFPVHFISGEVPEVNNIGKMIPLEQLIYCFSTN